MPSDYRDPVELKECELGGEGKAGVRHKEEDI